MESIPIKETDLRRLYKDTREQTQALATPLEIEDFVVQPVKDVSPLKWHLAHTTWFFETFVLNPYVSNYTVFHPKYSELFNSYYLATGNCWSRENRGQLTRPTVKEIVGYREYIDNRMVDFLSSNNISEEIRQLIILGINHEQQHQELFLYDVKRILGNNPLYPEYVAPQFTSNKPNRKTNWLSLEEGIYEIGFHGAGFHFDNEKSKHKVFIHDYQIASQLVTNEEFIDFIESGGYKKFNHWLSEGWDWVNENQIQAPEYWKKEDGKWWHYTLNGLELVKGEDPLCHVSFYEADAFARWRGYRLPTEQEWEVACNTFSPSISEKENILETKNYKVVQTETHDFFGNVWEWTASSYTPYPFYQPPAGTLGEYNGKFMVNQMVLRGGSFGTPKNHIRSTYRNFYHPYLRWMFSGIRLAKHI